MRKEYLWIPVCLGALALAWFAQFWWLPDGWSLKSAAEIHVVSEIAPVSAVYISEVSSSNRSAWSDDEGKYPDWVELYNAGQAPVDIAGWTLTDKPDRRIQFTFPAQLLAPGESLLVYCDGTLKNTYGAAYHAPFKLSALGDAVLLYDQGGAIMESLNVPSLPPDRVYARENSRGAFSVTDQFTPGLKNTPENHQSLIEHAQASDSFVVINEVMAENGSTLRDEDGDFVDWIELYNGGDAPVNLAGYSLSDSLANLHRWRLPEAVIEPGGYLIVYASGKNRAQAGALHASFKLNAEGETLSLSDASGRLASRASYELLKADKSLSRKPDGSYTTALAPTPGRANQ